MDDENDVTKVKVPKETNCSNLEPNLEITVTSISAIPQELNQQRLQNKNFTRENLKEKILKPIKDIYPTGSDWNEIAEIISKVLDNFYIMMIRIV